MKDPNRLCPGCMNEWGHPTKPCPVCGFVEKNYEKPPRWLPLKTVLNGKYMIGKVLGEGGFGITYVAWDLNLQVRVAIKEYFPIELATRETESGRSNSISALPGVRQENYRQGLEKFMTEARNLSRFYQLKGIVAVKEFFFENDTAYMVMEFVDGITLGAYLKQHGGQITEQEALSLFHPVMESLKVVHQSGIIHRDISPDNIMMTKDGRMKLIDFGAARFAGGDRERSLTIILKHGYAPAEQYQSHGNQGPWTDVYAICATMYRMITGKVPPSAMDRLHEDTLEEFSALGCRVSDKTACAVIDKGLAIRVEDRYRSMDELIRALYGTDKGRIRRKKKRRNRAQPDRSLWIAGVASLLAAGFLLGGILIFQYSRNTETIEETAASSVAAKTAQLSDSPAKKKGGTEEKKAGGTDNRLWPTLSLQELEPLFMEANEAQKTLAAAGNYLISLREDGSVAGSGQNTFGQLDLGNWSQIVQVSAGKNHTLGLKSDGTALAAGDTGEGKCAVDLWKDLTAVAAGDAHSLGLKADGTVSVAGVNWSGLSSASSWSGIQQIAAGSAHSLGLKEDGTVVAAGDDENSACRTEGWTDIVAIYARGSVSAGLKGDGTVVIAGDETLAKETQDWKQVVSLALGDGFIAGLLSDKSVRVAGSGLGGNLSVSDWEDICAIAASDGTLFGKKADGSILRTFYEYGSAGKPDFNHLTKVISCGGYLLGLTEEKNVLSWGLSGRNPGVEEVSGWNDIIDISGNSEAAFGLNAKGTVEMICGEAAGYDTVREWKGIRDIAAAEGLVAGLCEDGTVILTGPAAEESSQQTVKGWNNVTALTEGNGGCLAAVLSDGTARTLPDYGWTLSAKTPVVSAAAGNNIVVTAFEDGTVKSFGSAARGSGNVYSWRNIIQTVTGKAHTAGLKSDGTVLAAGSNANGQCDVGSWANVVYIAAGDYYTIGILSDGTMVTAGKLPGEY